MKRININSFFHSIIIIIFSFSNQYSSAQESSRSFNRVCYGNSTTGNRSTYNNFKTNVYSLLSVLASKSSSSLPGFFYNTTIVDENLPRAYGSYLCRGDLQPRVCEKCVTDVTGFLTRADITNSDCYGAGVYYKDPQCIVHYSNSSEFNVYKNGRALNSGSIGGNVGDYTSYNETLSSTMLGLIREAEMGNWTVPNFETKVVEVQESKIYVLVQCSPNISSKTCSECLRELYSRLPNCCNGTQGGYVVYGNCLMKYDNQSFIGSGCHSFLPNLWHVTLVLIVTLYIVFMGC